MHPVYTLSDPHGDCGLKLTTSCINMTGDIDIDSNGASTAQSSPSAPPTNGWIKSLQGLL